MLFFKSESILFKELDLFYHFIMGFTCLIIFLTNINFYIIDFMGLQREDWVSHGQFSSYYYLHINRMLMITLHVSNI